MKTTTLIASIIGGIVVVGGGGVAAGIAISDDTPAIETVQPVETIDATHAPEPAASAEPVETSTPDPVESAVPEYSEAEQIFLPWARENYEFYRSTTPTLPAMSDQDMLDALHQACGFVDDFTTDLSVIPGFATAADLDPFTWEDDANSLFIDAARVGDGAGVSYCS